MDYSDFPVDKASSGGNCREDFEKRIREAIAQDCRRRANIAYDKDPQLLIDIIELIKKTSEEIAGVIERMAPSNDSLDSAMQHAFFGEVTSSPH